MGSEPPFSANADRAAHKIADAIFLLGDCDLADQLQWVLDDLNEQLGADHVG